MPTETRFDLVFRPKRPVDEESFDAAMDRLCDAFYDDARLEQFGPVVSGASPYTLRVTTSCAYGEGEIRMLSLMFAVKGLCALGGGEWDFDGPILFEDD